MRTIIKKGVFIGLLILSFVGSLFAQSVTGKVTNELSGEELAFANVVISLN